MEDEGKADEGQIEQLRKIQELKRQFDEEMVYVLKTNKSDRALKLKSEIERRINLVQELITPPGSFNKEQIEALEAKGYVLYRLTGESIESLRERGYKLYHGLPQNHGFVNKRSRQTEVAFNPDPDKFFIQGSNKKTLREQQQMVNEYSDKLQQDIKGVKAVIGEAPDYVELAFNYTGEYGSLFGGGYRYIFTRTVTEFKTRFGEVVAAGVGHFYPDHGLDISFFNPDDGAGGLLVVPLVVPDNS